MENSSEAFLAANRSFSQATRDIESIQAGREAATRGRSEDIIPAYQALRPQGQAAFRAGYVDPASRSNPRLDQQSSPAAQRRVPRRSRGDGAGQRPYAALPCARANDVRNAQSRANAAVEASAPERQVVEFAAASGQTSTRNHKSPPGSDTAM
jgi:hypothetical protein